MWWASIASWWPRCRFLTRARKPGPKARRHKAHWVGTLTFPSLCDPGQTLGCSEPQLPLVTGQPWSQQDSGQWLPCHPLLLKGATGHCSPGELGPSCLSRLVSHPSSALGAGLSDMPWLPGCTVSPVGPVWASSIGPHAFCPGYAHWCPPPTPPWPVCTKACPYLPTAPERAASPGCALEEPSQVELGQGTHLAWTCQPLDPFSYQVASWSLEGGTASGVERG